MVHIAAGEYSPDKPRGFEFPDNVTVCGGCDELPTDNSLSGTMRNPVSPANKNGYATIFPLRLCLTNGIVNLIDEDNKPGHPFSGDQLTTNTDGQAICVNGSNVTPDSWIRIQSRSIGSLPHCPSLCQGQGIHTSTSINRSTYATPHFSNNQGGEWGCCLNLLTDGVINIENPLFSHNTNNFMGGTAILSYDASPKVNIINSTFYDNTIECGWLLDVPSCVWRVVT